MSEEQTDDTRKALIRNLAWFLEFHKRENKPTWWRMFDRLGLTEVDLFDDMDCLVGLSRTEKERYLPSERARNYIYEYSFDQDQHFKGQQKSFYVLGEEKLKVTATHFDSENGFISLQCSQEPGNIISLIPDEYVRPNPIPEAIESVTREIIETNFSRSAIVDFLLRAKPKFSMGEKSRIVSADSSGGQLISEVVKTAIDLDNSYLCIQGPPGAGKTYTARYIISELLKRGKRVGISSNSHKAITNLLGGVADQIIHEKILGHLIKVGGDAGDSIFEKVNVLS